MSTSVAATAGPGAALNTRRQGRLFAADIERMDLERGLPVGAISNRRADLQHVGPEDLLLALDQMVRVLLHERHATLARLASLARRHDLHQPYERCRLPVPFGPESVAIGHQALAGEARKLVEPMKVLERRREGPVASAREEGAHSNLLPSGIAQALAAVSAPLQCPGEDILSLVFLHQMVDLRVSHLSNPRDQVTDRVTVGRPTKLNLRLEAVATGHRNFTHVHAAEAHDLQCPRFGDRARDA